VAKLDAEKRDHETELGDLRQPDRRDLGIPLVGARPIEDGEERDLPRHLRQECVDERALDAKFFAALRARHPGERFFLGNIDDESAGGTTLARTVGLSLGHRRGM
jgi:hypothetical protein